MEEDEALFLPLKSSNLGSGTSDLDVAKSLVDVLGYIPLAIDQAGAYIQQQECDFDWYLDLYKRHHRDLMSDPHFTGASDYGSPIYRTWDM